MKNNLSILKRLITIFLLIIVFIPTNCMADDWGQIAKLLPEDRHSGARFGYSVSLSGDYAIVGASLEELNAEGKDTLYGAGAAYIFIREGTKWIQQQKLVASDRNESDLFGYSVCISGDYAIVGAIYDAHNADHTDSAFRSGSAYIFKREGTKWIQKSKISAPDRQKEDDFGVSVSISGKYAIVGACFQNLSASFKDPLSDAGAAYFYVQTDTGWVFQQKVTSGNRHIGDNFGNSVSISGDRAFVGAYDEDINPNYNDSAAAGAAYVFERSGTLWQQTDRIVPPDLHPSDNFGTSVCIYNDYAIVGSPRHDYDTSSVVTPQAGAAYIYKLIDKSWILQQKIYDSTRYRDHQFGYSVSIIENYALAGTHGTNYAYMFGKSGAEWNLQKKLKASDHVNVADFGWAVSVSGEYSIVGAYSEWRDSSGGNNLSEAGAVYVFGHVTTDIEETELEESTRKLSLLQTFPNPFSESTSINYELQTAGRVKIDIFSSLGEKITSLVDEWQEAGSHSATFDVRANGRSPVQSGMYFYRIKIGERIECGKMILIK